MDEASAATTPGRDAAHALVESYRRVRELVLALLAERAYEKDEFSAAFPPLSTQPLSETERAPGPQAAIQAAATRSGAAVQASLLLRQLGGWLDGLFQSATLERRMRYEAEAVAQLRVKS